MPAMEA